MGTKLAANKKNNKQQQQQQQQQQKPPHIRVLLRARHKMSVAPALASLSITMLWLLIETSADTECQPGSFSSVTVGDFLPGHIAQTSCKFASWQLQTTMTKLVAVM
mmetsp:Transcript_33235/g.59676  ORF Transcript_33235/g.59676 Transcript_33235/m.59676 type:complete len:106 (+) Transcript_33235:103-420(+)